MPQETYEEACVRHATNQGLIPPRDLLQQHGFSTQLLQTGGFVMVLQAYKDERVQVWITQDSDPQDAYGDDPGTPATYLITAQSVPSKDDDYQDEEELAASYGVLLSDVLSTVQQYALEVYD